MARTVAIGIQDFGGIIENKYFYVDKTGFIKEWWENGDTVTLITRPRRFGKSLTMSMLEHFFSVNYEGKGSLFENLDIWKDLAKFIRELFNSAFKSNPYLERAVLTGITRVSKESVFSDLNNIEVVTSSSEKYASSFGFTEPEVLQALEEFGLQDNMQDIKRWYDGFHFGNCDSIYNPWPITQFLDKRKLADYWINTSSNSLAGKLVREGSPKLKTAAEDLLQGKTISAVIDEQIVFDQLDEDDDNAVWSFLLASGYLTIKGYENAGFLFDEESVKYELALTNHEIVSAFRKMVHGWFSKNRCGYNDFIKALLVHDLKKMNLFMNKAVMSSISFFDSGKKPSEQAEPERFYHGFVLGLIVDLDNRYIVTSNRESGYGRYDVLLQPRDRSGDGIIFEFKVFDADEEKSLKDTAASAVRQVIGRKYAAVLENSGVEKDRIRIYGFAFRGKEVLIEGGYVKDYEGMLPQL